MDYLEEFIDLYSRDIDPARFVIARANHYIRLINPGGIDIGRSDDDSAPQPHHLEALLRSAAVITRQGKRLVQEWRNLQQHVPKLKEAWKKGQTLFREALECARSNQEDMENFTMINFAVDCYAYLTASRVYPDNPMLLDWLLKGICWRGVGIFLLRRISLDEVFVLGNAEMLRNQVKYGIRFICLKPMF